MFKQNGLERYRPLREKFDPNLHSALFEIPDPGQKPGYVAVVTKVRRSSLEPLSSLVHAELRLCCCRLATSCMTGCCGQPRWVWSGQQTAHLLHKFVLRAR